MGRGQSLGHNFVVDVGVVDEGVVRVVAIPVIRRDDIVNTNLQSMMNTKTQSAKVLALRHENGIVKRRLQRYPCVSYTLAK